MITVVCRTADNVWQRSRAAFTYVEALCVAILTANRDTHVVDFYWSGGQVQLYLTDCSLDMRKHIFIERLRNAGTT